MNEGRIEQIGSPVEIYENPQSPFVMKFVGEVNVLPADAFHPSHPDAGGLSSGPTAGHGGDSLYIRPHDLELLEEPAERSTPAQVRRLVHLGRDVHVELQLDNGHHLHAQLPREWLQGHRNGLRNGVTLYLRPRSVRSFS
jgi:sulfate transport system ATP-binding protein